MALINFDKLTPGITSPDVQTLSVSDEFEYIRGTGQVIHIMNQGAETVTATILGDKASTISVGGLGTPIDISGGYSFSVEPNSFNFLVLDSIEHYLQDSKNMPTISSSEAGLAIIAYVV